MTSSRLRSDLLWSGAELALRYGVQFVTLIVLARFIDPAGFGLMAMAMIVLAVGNVLSDSGMTVALTRLPSAEPTHFASARRFGLLSGLGCVVLTAILAWPIAYLFSEPAVALLLLVAALALPPVGAATAPDAYLIRERRFAERATFQLVASLAGSLVAIGMAITGAGPWALVGQLVCTSIVRWVLLERAAPTQGTPSMAALRTLLPMSGYLVASGLLDALALRLQAALLGRLFGTTELGFYSQAQTIQQVPTTAFSAIVNKVALPRFAVAFRDDMLRPVAVVCLRGTWLAFCPAMFLAALLAPFLVPALLGTRWSPMSPILAVLCVAASLWPVHVVNLLVCTARGDGRGFFQLEVAKKVILLAAVAGFGWRGPLPMASAIAIASLLGGFVNAGYSGRVIGYGAVAQMRDLAPATLATLAATAASMGVERLLPWPPMPKAAAMAIAFVIIYAVPGLLLGKRALRAWRSLNSQQQPDSAAPTVHIT
jgi:teichuronic acid exporter